MANLKLQEVKPGDLIKAEDWNQIIRLLNNFDERVTNLEASSIGGSVVITRLVYTPPLRMGHTLEIQGQNFGTSRGAQQVQFDNNFIVRYGKSDDSTLFIIVPTDLPDIGENGRDVLLRVSNGASSDSRTIRIFPIDIPIAGNIVDLTFVSVDPNPLAANKAAKLNFTANSRAGNTAEFDVIITISDNTLQAGKRLFTGNTEVPNFRLKLQPLKDLPFSINLPALPASLANGQFRISILFRSGSMVGSLTRDYSVGTPIPEPDKTINIFPERMEVLDNNGFPDSNLGDYDGGSNTISLKAGRTGTMWIRATFEQEGTYDYWAKIIKGNGWSANIGGSDRGSITIDQGDFAGGSLAEKNIAFDLNLGTNITAGANGELEFTIQRQGENKLKAILMLLAPK